MTVKVFIDTNVLIYARDRQASAKALTCQAWLKALAKRSCMTMSLQVLNECYSVLRQQLGEGPVLKAERGFLAGLRTLATAPFDLDNLDIAWTVQDRYQTSWWDGLILSSAVRAGCTHLLSEDSQGSDVIEGVRIVDPFAKTPEEFVAGLSA